MALGGHRLMPEAAGKLVVAVVPGVTACIVRRSRQAAVWQAGFPVGLPLQIGPVAGRTMRRIDFPARRYLSRLCAVTNRQPCCAGNKQDHKREPGRREQHVAAHYRFGRPKTYFASVAIPNTIRMTISSQSMPMPPIIAPMRSIMSICGLAPLPAEGLPAFSAVNAAEDPAFLRRAEQPGRIVRVNGQVQK